MIFTLEFGDYTFPNQTFEVEGFPVNNNIKEGAISRKHGPVIQTPFLRSRKFKIRGIIHNSTKASSLAELDTMQQNLLASESFFRDRADREIKAYASRFRANQEEGSDKAIINVEIDLVAQNPFFLAVGASIIESIVIPDGTTTFNIDNLGNVFAEPKIYGFASGGTINDDFTLTNTSNANQQARFRGDIVDGATMVMDTGELTVLNDTVDGLSDFEGDFLDLVLGSNIFSYDGSTITLTIEHRRRWF